MKKTLLHAEKINRTKCSKGWTFVLDVHPSKNWQERVYNFSVFFADQGYSWLETCLEEMEIDESKLIILAI
ncbi:bacillithiol biosynthesis BshC [Flavobacterium sp. B17]|uniref:bacillithiol biosynthesis protein BshC n=1 Tax=Flavobacterium sp. B17 TaxID=95618 RepID=UPI0021CD218C|nr:bacillithiol biosynthesis BshC [Flavobacterium sp. B17]